MGVMEDFEVSLQVLVALTLTYLLKLMKSR
ncbi:hypothetical protein RDABS01_029511 [Bienertia sinuspersici]